MWAVVYADSGQVVALRRSEAEALSQVARDLHAGREVDLDGVGRFTRVNLSAPWIIYRAAPALLEPAGEVPSYLRRQAE